MLCIVARCLTDYLLKNSYIVTLEFWERMDTEGAKLSGTHWRGRPAYKGSPGVQGGPNSAVAGPCERL